MSRTDGEQRRRTRAGGTRDAAQRSRTNGLSPGSGPQYRSLFEDSPISLWEEDFTEVKKLIESLRRSGVRDFGKYFARHPEAVADMASRVKVVEVNRATLDLFKASTVEEFRDGLGVVFAVESYDTFREELIAIAEGKPRFEAETVVKTLEGETRQVLLGWSVPPGYEETLSRVFVSIIDVTERKRAERALRESEERLRTVVTNAPVFLFAIDREGVVRLSEGRGREAISRRPGEAVGRSAFDLYGDVPEVIENVRRALAGETFTATVELPGVTLEVHHAPIRDQEGQVSGFIGVATDVTERNRAEQALQESEERFRKLSEAAYEGIAIHDKGRILDANRAFAAMFGYELPEVVGMTASQLTAPESRDLVSKNILSGYEQPYEIVGLRKDGTTFPVETCGKAIRFEGRLVRVAAMRDITEHKRAEEALQRAREEIENKIEPYASLGTFYGLTFRELTVLYLVAAGKSDREIGIELGISHLTVQKHVTHILEKMGAGSRTEASVRAIREGLVD